VDFLQQRRIVRLVPARDADAEGRRADLLLFSATPGFPVAKLLTCLVIDEVLVRLGIGEDVRNRAALGKDAGLPRGQARKQCEGE
jgi:hypothetical protein